MPIKNINLVNDQLGGTGVHVVPVEDGCVFRKSDGSFTRLSTITEKNASDLSVEELVALGKQVAGTVPSSPAEIDAFFAELGEKTYKVETKEISPGWNDSGYRFRIVCSDGRFSGWAPYDRVCFLDDTAALSPYFHGGSDTQTMSLKEAMAHIAIGEHVEQTAVARDDEDDSAVEIDDTAN